MSDVLAPDSTIARNARVVGETSSAVGGTNSGKYDAISVPDLHNLLTSENEVALLDVREEGVHSTEGHIFLSASAPLSRLEVRIGILVPRRATPVVVFDAGDGALAARAAIRLRELGYADVRRLEGGLAAWGRAGHEVFTDISSVSKSFGEFVEREYGTPHISVAELKAKLDAGEDLVVLDSRTLSEFEEKSIPGAFAAPGAELVQRAFQFADQPEKLIVVNCAARTRSIIGAQALINAGVPNRVVSLANGTMAWLLEGHQLAHGERRELPTPGPRDLERAQQSVTTLTERFGVRRIDGETYRRFVAEAGERSLYRLDVRRQEEYEAGHLPGSYSTPGGQLVQGLDRWVATRNARLVLIDGPDAIRATITASWLIQIGWGEVYVYADGLDGALETGPEPVSVLGTVPDVATIDVAALSALLERDAATVIDLDTSRAYRFGHIPGAFFAIRARFADSLKKLGGSGPVVIAGPDRALAALAAAEAAAIIGRPVKVLTGGTAAWKAAGLPLEAGAARALDAINEDIRLNAYQADTEDRHALFREHLAWEVQLADQVERDDTTPFRRFPLAGARLAATDGGAR
ncbi:hypothetical protein LGR54_08495 [Ancylobacter sp. Lp-2]|uniref:rhodanese-like domain-containing protein n=1 Tax=Ancylobacter sp. Lp-2 TaxID=2881339 RepID=UPI001E5EC3AD|nr:rhodanese-like domain-containing protein [Ancylobacter sp. Lp-2]MCB4768638.1 hypothetical protein [Ancylobacter sp. Lp-2]